MGDNAFVLDACKDTNPSDCMYVSVIENSSHDARGQRIQNFDFVRYRRLFQMLFHVGDDVRGEVVWKVKFFIDVEPKLPPVERKKRQSERRK